MSTLRMGSLVVMLILFYSPALAKDPSGPPVKETICHKPGTEAQKTLTVAQQAVDSHIAEHGDYIGACGSLSSIACPCFDNISQVGFSDQASCTNSGGNVDITDFSSSFLFAQASESTCGLAIIGTENDTEILEPVISPEEGAACVEAINNLCATLSQP